MEIKMTKLATIDSLTNTYNRGYFYHKVGTDFSYEGKGVKLQKYDKEKNWAEVINDKEDIIEVSLDVIARIL